MRKPPRKIVAPTSSQTGQTTLPRGALSWRPMLLGAVFRRGAFRERTFRAYWAEDRDINDEAVLAELAGEDAGAFAALSARMQSPEIKKELATATQSAIDRGVFGAPTWLVDGQELFWGQDRIALVERALGH